MSELPADPVPATDDLLPVVVGATLRAEIYDRPLALRLLERVHRWQHRAAAGGLVAVTCTDLWYLNQPELRQRPTICLGAPQVNAAAAWFGRNTPTVLVVEGSYRVQLDPEYLDLQACIWGVDRRSTEAAIELFTDRYLEPFLAHAHDLPAAST